MKTALRFRIPALLLLAIGLAVGSVACGPKTVTAGTAQPPNSPQTQAHNINKTFADSINAAVKTSIAMRDQGKLSPTITRQIEDWAVAASVVSDKIETEIISSDPWPVQKQKILVLLTGFQIPNTVPVETTVQAALSAVGVLLGQMKAQVAQ